MLPKTLLKNRYWEKTVSECFSKATLQLCCPVNTKKLLSKEDRIKIVVKKYRRKMLPKTPFKNPFRKVRMETLEKKVLYENAAQNTVRECCFAPFNWVIVTPASALSKQTLEICTARQAWFVTYACLGVGISHALKDCMNPGTRCKPYKIPILLPTK